LIFQSKITIFTPLEQGKFLSEKHRNEAGAEVGAFIGAYSGGYPFSISGDIRSVPS